MVATNPSSLVVISPSSCWPMPLSSPSSPPSSEHVSVSPDPFELPPDGLKEFLRMHRNSIYLFSSRLRFVPEVIVAKNRFAEEGNTAKKDKADSGEVERIWSVPGKNDKTTFSDSSPRIIGGIKFKFWNNWIMKIWAHCRNMAEAARL